MKFPVFCLCIIAFATVSAVHAATPLSLAEAQHLAARDAPQVDAQTAVLRAAEQATIGAGEQSDPKLIVGVDNLPVDGADRFNLSRDFMTMRRIGFMQEFTRDEKLTL